MKTIVVAVALPLLFIVLVGGAMSDDHTASAGADTNAALDAVNPGAVPAAARPWLADLSADLVACPELPEVWVIAEVQAESGWNPRAYSPAGAAGLLQLEPATWTAAGGGGSWNPAQRPPPDHPVWDPARHLAVAIPWMCTNLRAMTSYLAGTGKTVTPLEAMAVCHIAGCSRVTNSTTGIPTAGEASCGAACADAVHDYLTAIEHFVDIYGQPTAAGSATASATSSGTSPAAPFSGTSTGCTLPDPTGTGGCVTPATAWMLTQVQTAFGHQAASCWDPHLQNPTSDHPKGKACDLTIGRPGVYPDAADVAHGWTIATWLQTNAPALHVSYLIWQDRIWSPSKAAQGWRVYTGGGIYDVDTPTGGHYDHIHVSITE